ncbi:MAG: M56 family metallopeptidase, partial [Maribacter sp.]
MISILIKSSIIIAVVFAFYKLFLEKESFFATNRIFLVLGLIIAFILPFIALPELMENQGVFSFWLSNASEVTTNSEEMGTSNFNKIENSGIPTAAVEIMQQTSKLKTKSIAYWISLFYFFGVLLLTINLIAQLVKLAFKIKKNDDRIKDGQFTIINAEVDDAPCSFFNYIFINPNKYDHKTYGQILNHEKVHAKSRHSLDLLIAELAIIILWFNPIIWFYRKEIEKNCEFQTDTILLESRLVEPQNYQLSLLEIASDKKSLNLVSNYNQSLIKKRIIMMNKQKSNKFSYFKYAFIAPVLLITLLLLNQPFALNAQESLNADFHNEDGYSEEYSHHGDHSDNLPSLHKASADGNE